MRVSSATPSDASRSAIRRLTLDFGISSARAAAVKLPSAITVAKRAMSARTGCGETLTVDPRLAEIAPQRYARPDQPESGRCRLRAG